MSKSQKFGHSKKVFISSVLGVALLASSVVFSLPEDHTLSLFSNSKQITSKNAADSWTGSHDNPFREKLPSSLTEKVDPIVMLILKKGYQMNDSQFAAYLTNLSRGLDELSKNSLYLENQEVQNILKYIVFEVRAAQTIISQTVVTNSVLSSVTDVISSSDVTTQRQVVPPGNSSTQTPTINYNPPVVNVAPVQTPVPQVAKSPFTSENVVSIKGVRFFIEGYDLDKSPLEFFPATKEVHLKNFGVTFDFSKESEYDPQGVSYVRYTTTDAICKSKGRNYRLPTSSEVIAFLNTWSENVGEMGEQGITSDNTIPKGYYRISVIDPKNDSITKQTFLIPSFIKKDYLEKLLYIVQLERSPNDTEVRYSITFSPGKSQSASEYLEMSYTMSRSMYKDTITKSENGVFESVKIISQGSSPYRVNAIDVNNQFYLPTDKVICVRVD